MPTSQTEKKILQWTMELIKVKYSGETDLITDHCRLLKHKFVLFFPLSPEHTTR